MKNLADLADMCPTMHKYSGPSGPITDIRTREETRNKIAKINQIMLTSHLIHIVKT